MEGSAETVPSVIPSVHAINADCVVLELSLPQGSALQLIREMRERAGYVRIIIMSMTSDAELVSRALRNGATGYVSNTYGATELLEAVEAVAQERSYVGQELAQPLALRGVFGPETEPMSVLSNREYEILSLIGQGFPISRIAEALNISGSTVNTHRQRIMKKLSLSSAGELTRYAIELSLTTYGE
jgi:DNA-binding NarL/FixJ family response regulator